MSGIVQVNDSYVILFCEGFTATEKVSLTDPTIKRELYDDIHEKKQRIAMAEGVHAPERRRPDRQLPGPDDSIAEAACFRQPKRKRHDLARPGFDRGSVRPCRAGLGESAGRPCSSRLAVKWLRLNIPA